MCSPLPAAVSRAGPGDAEAWVSTYLDALAAAYALLMPTEFFTQQRARAPELIELYRALFAAQHADPQRPHRAWLAADARGPVGIAEVRLGPAGWEREAGYPPAVPSRQLVKLYTLPRAHGSGLGQELLDVAIGTEPAYLWIIAGNGRAETFYRHNGFVPDGLATPAGPSWFDRPTFRMHRLPEPLHPAADLCPLTPPHPPHRAPHVAPTHPAQQVRELALRGAEASRTPIGTRAPAVRGASATTGVRRGNGRGERSG